MSRREPRKITPSYLHNVVMWYLESHDAPVAHVRRLLMQRVRRAVAVHDQELAACEAMVDTLLASCVENGLLDDRRYSLVRCRTQRERGRSEAQLRADLRSKGVSSALIDEVVTATRAEGADPDRLAAIRYARRRRFGPWRRPDAREDAARKELAAMARAGFRFDVARAVLDADDAMALEDELPRGW
ncbi:MAG: RecX family transcriptional regulator [Alphaproteobacteria bacterium]|nr:RecX family transcriptional regulator [Alphaproteobacteria bacterium]